MYRLEFKSRRNMYRWEFKSRRNRLAGHVTYMEQKSNVYRFLVVKT